MNDDNMPEDPLIPMTKQLSTLVKDDLSPLEFASVNDTINKFDFKDLHDFIYSMLIDENGNVVENINRSLYLKKISQKAKLLKDENILIIIKRVGLLIDKHMAKLATSYGLDKQASLARNETQKKFLAENYMYHEIKDIELHFKNSNILWELELNKKKKDKKTGIIVSLPNTLNWQKNEKIIKDLFILLAKHNDFIENDFDKFQSLFTINNKKLFNYDGKIKWIKNNLSVIQIAYLFNELCKRGYLHHSQQRKINSIISSRISNKDGNSTCFKNLPKIYSNFNSSQRNGAEKSQPIKDIDNILNKLTS